MAGNSRDVTLTLSVDTLGEDGIILSGPRQNVINAAGGNTFADNLAITVTSGASNTTSKARIRLMLG